MSKTIKVMFSCSGCGLKKEPVIVRERRDDENIVSYVEHCIAYVISFQHSLSSPACKSKIMSEVWIPTNEQGICGREPQKD